MEFDITALLLLLTMLCNFGIGFYVLAKNPKNKINIFFSLLAFQIALWNLVNLLSFAFVETQLVILFTKLTLLSVLFIPSTTIIFCTFFSERQIPKKYLYALFIPAVLHVPFIFTKYNIVGFDGEPRGDNFIPGLLYLVYAVYFLLFVGAAIVILIRFYQTTKNYVKKRQAQYIILGLSLTGVIGLTTNAVFPLIWSAQYNVYGTPASILFSFFAAYAITRYRLFDIKFVVKQTIFKIVSALITSLVAVGIAIVINERISQGSFYSFIIILLINIFILQLALIYLYKRYVDSKPIDFSLISDSIIFEEGTKKIMDHFQEITKKILHEEYQVSNYDLVVLDWQELTYKSSTEKIIKFKYNADLAAFARRSTKVLIEEELDEQLRASTMDLRRNLKNFMKKHKFAFAIPLYTDMDIYGFIFLTNETVIHSNIYSSNSISDLNRSGHRLGKILERILMHDAIVVKQVPPRVV